MYLFPGIFSGTLPLECKFHCGMDLFCLVHCSHRNQGFCILKMLEKYFLIINVNPILPYLSIFFQATTLLCFSPSHLPAQLFLSKENSNLTSFRKPLLKLFT